MLPNKKRKKSLLIITLLVASVVWLFWQKEDTEDTTSITDYIGEIIHSNDDLHIPLEMKSNVNFWKNVFFNTSIYSVVYFTPNTHISLKQIDTVINFSPNENRLFKVSLMDDDQEIASFDVESIDPSAIQNVLLINQAKTKIDEIYDDINKKMHESNAIEEDEDIGYTRGRKEKFEEAWSFSGLYIDKIKKIFAEEKIPTDLAYLAFTESSFDIFAASGSNAVGIYQMIPETGRKFGLKIRNNLDERKDPFLEARAAAKYLKSLHDEFGNWLWAVNAYHSGEDNLRKALAWAEKNYQKKPTEFNGTLRDFQYVKVISEFPNDDEFNTNTLKYGKNSARYTTLFLAFLSGKDSLNSISIENPINIVPIKVNYSVDYIENKNVYIEPGDSLVSLAYYYGVSVEDIKKWNNLDDSLIRAGETLKINTETPPLTFGTLFKNLELDEEEIHELFDINYSYRDRESSLDIFLNSPIYNHSTINSTGELSDIISSYLADY